MSIRTFALQSDFHKASDQRLLVIADANLTGTRYAMLRRVCAALRGRICAQAAAILRPVLEHISAALEAEHTRRRADHV
jgi:hypothetical protein